MKPADKQTVKALSIPSKILATTAALVLFASAEPPYEAVSRPLTDPVVTIAQGAMVWYPFTVTDHMRLVRLAGRIVAHGGIGNDIQVFVTDGDGLENLKNGHRAANVWYATGKVTVAEADVAINVPGDYYLVFNNRYSPFTKKYIENGLELRFLWLK